MESRGEIKTRSSQRLSFSFRYPLLIKQKIKSSAGGLSLPLARLTIVIGAGATIGLARKSGMGLGNRIPVTVGVEVTNLSQYY